MVESTSPLGGLRPIPYMGVIQVVAEAMQWGFRDGDPDWCNLGQGQPEVGEIEGAPPRISEIHVEPGDHAYGPVNGMDELRQAVAAHYNRLYRQGKASRYDAANVGIAAGGRVVLSRAFAAIGAVNVGYQVPDYTAYEDLIGYHEHRFSPVLLSTLAENGFAIPAVDLAREVRTRGLGALVLSNPCNPTGQVVQGKELARYVAIAREEAATLILDEFYSHFIYTPDGRPGAGPVSAAAYVQDVDLDPVLIVDGLTKSYRYPGWRLGWAVGPKPMIDTLGRAASAIDGGPSQLVQRAALQVLEPQRADQETKAVRKVFARKRNLMIRRLREMSIDCARESEGTFYAWAFVGRLRPPLADGEAFFREALKHKVITVPGVFFDVNPGKRRRRASPLRQWVRFSFGPAEASVADGLDRLEAMIRGAQRAR
jgi:aspartate/methionine/tyrosine aminotransferase